MTQKPIEAYGLIGNLDTCALVGRDGSIDWCCFPHIDSPSVFAHLLDATHGGQFTIQPADGFDAAQQYRHHTNILDTEFMTATGQATVTDCMPVTRDASDEATPKHAIYRKATCETGTVTFDITFNPRFNYAQTTPDLVQTPAGVVAHADDETLHLHLSASDTFDLDTGTATATLTLGAGETVWLVASYNQPAIAPSTHYQHVLEDTASYWRDWVHSCPEEGRCPFSGPWHELVVRSELTLKLLIHADKGTICAAPTTSLPEEIGGVRNWDYRYTWVRDSAFTVQALYELGHETEATEYLEWLLSVCEVDGPDHIQPVYSMQGDRELEETVLEHLVGYRDSSPVRVGNDAHEQRQLDVYGELINAIYHMSLYGEDVAATDWETLRALITHVCEVWQEPDVGIWEVRTDPKHFVHSKVMCWVALDRGIRMAEDADLPAPLREWRDTRDQIKTAVLEHGYSESADSFVQSFETDETLDATALLIPVVGFLPPDDRRVQHTIDTIQDRLTTADGLVKRYEGVDGVAGDDSAFILCSCWLVDALARSNRLTEARAVFDTIYDHANAVGLLAEEIDSTSGEQRGNFPQAFSHIGLINSVLYLNWIDTESPISGNALRGDERRGTSQLPPIYSG